MLHNEALLIAATVALAISSGGFFFAQFSRSTRKVHKALQSSGLLLVLGTGVLVAALVT